MIPGVPMSTILPAGTRAALVAASQVESRIEHGEPCPARAAAIDAVVAVTRREYPQFFHEEK